MLLQMIGINTQSQILRSETVEAGRQTKISRNTSSNMEQVQIYFSQEPSSGWAVVKVIGSRLL